MTCKHGREVGTAQVLLLFEQEAKRPSHLPKLLLKQLGLDHVLGCWSAFMNLLSALLCLSVTMTYILISPDHC